MKKPNQKLIASAFLVLATISLIVTVSYAWVTLSGSPALTGVEINIGGTNTIQMAPNITEVVDGEVLHYPGRFQDSFDVGDYKSYNYLNSLAGMTPVSTADGIHWFMPSDEAEMEVKGTYSLDDYLMDNSLTHANISTTSTLDVLDGKKGSYVYLDFWVVSPMRDCNLRVSIGSQHEGSYVIGLPQVVKDESTLTGYRLEEGNDEVAACARVGFLVNTDEVATKTIQQYKASKAYNGDYKALRGTYQEPGQTITDISKYQFTIYEPNGDQHNDVGVSYIHSNEGLTYTICKEGDYAITRPIGYDNGKAVLKNISNILTVQKKNRWKQANNGEMLLGQIFQSSMLKQDLTDKTEEEIMQKFYYDTWQNNYSDYVMRATFCDSTRELYYAGDGSVITQENMAQVKEATTTRNAIIVNLERNVPQRVRMYVWLEGQDVDCVREAALENFAIGIELAGSTQD